ncbi:methyltransferase domain-containing protein [Leptospira sp. WS92.C1]
MLVNLGCGNRYHSSWKNIDFIKSGPTVIQHDLSKGIPLVDSSANVVYHSHILEHFSKEAGAAFLRDCFRILKPGGILRVVVPDLEMIISEYGKQMDLARKGDSDAANRYQWILLELFDQVARNRSGGEMLDYWKQKNIPAEAYLIERLGAEVKQFLDKIRSSDFVNVRILMPFYFRILRKLKSFFLNCLGYSLEMAEIGKFRLSGEIHYWMYDEYSLKDALLQTGFVNPQKRNANESNIENFNDYLLDIEADGSVRKPDSLFVEARKPL